MSSPAGGTARPGERPDASLARALGDGRALFWAWNDASVMTRRYVLAMVRVPAVVVFALIQPVMFVVLFRYVFGGAIRAPGCSSHVQ